MNDDTQNEVIMWEYKWSGSDLNEMNRLGKQGWEAVGTNATAKALPLGATVGVSVGVLFKRRFHPAPPRENAAGLRLKQLLEEERNRRDE